MKFSILLFGLVWLYLFIFLEEREKRVSLMVGFLWEDGVSGFFFLYKRVVRNLEVELKIGFSF